MTESRTKKIFATTSAKIWVLVIAVVILSYRCSMLQQQANDRSRMLREVAAETRNLADRACRDPVEPEDLRKLADWLERDYR